MDTENLEHKDPLLTMKGIGKSFPGVRALHQVDFTLQCGEIHALMGENGAGKSTLIKVLTGVYFMDEGNIQIETKPAIINSPSDAQKHGISTVYQEVNLCPNLTVAENLFLGHEPHKSGLIDWRKMNTMAADLLGKLNIVAAPTTQLDNCSIAIQQLIAIARAVSVECKILILDEPTSSLDKDEVQILFALMRQLKEQGTGIIFITHFIDQVYEVCDRITVLRNGELVGEYMVENLPRLQLVANMLGKDLDDLANLKADKDEQKAHESEVPFLEANGLSSGVSRVAPFDLKVHKGEVVGFSGLLGSGRSELVRSIYGADKAIHGNLSVKGNTVRIKKPIDAMNHKMAYLPEDRKVDGIFPDLTVRENIIIAIQTKRGLFKRLSRKEMEKFADEYIELLSIKTPSTETPLRSLSGGNQQKVILARWLLTNPEFMILDEPTRGIDVGTKTEIQKLILKFAGEGKSIAFISSELEEMLRTCSRMVVMRDRNKVGELVGDDLKEEKIMQTIAGGEHASA
ncbi:MAG: sugar ABC transporter ATP-binding protein [Treponema sp.]|jgi:simple sugar transport system ATP-binding protein|nr:sugar ABC transporter ATP-binding protein [Treponema sp.]